MKSGVCPKCSGRNIKKYQPRSVVGDSAVWDYEYVGIFARAYSTRYVCLDCGYCERYFEDRHLERLKKNDKKGERCEKKVLD